MVACEVWTKLNNGDKASRESKTSDEGKWMIDEEDLSGKGVIDVLWDKYQSFDLGVIKFPLHWCLKRKLETIVPNGMVSTASLK